MTKTSLMRTCVMAALLLAARDGFSQQLNAAPPVEKPDNSITGRVVNSAGEPLAGATVNAFALGGRSRSNPATVDSHGNFKIVGLEPGLYSVSTSMPGYLYASRPNSGEPTNYVHVGESVTLTLYKGAVITGRVTGPNGPLVGVGVFATRVRDAAGKKFLGNSSFERRTDDRGIFRLYAMPPGSYILCASRPRVGTIMPSAYDNDITTYYPSATRDTAEEIVLHEGDEVTADIQYRGEPGHAISGRIIGVVEGQRPSFGTAVSIMLTDVRSGTQLVSAASYPDYSRFAIYGLADGEYELVASQNVSTGLLRSQPQRVTVDRLDVTGISLTLAPLASIEGRLVFESDANAACAKRKDSASRETLIYARRSEPEKKSVDDKVSTLTVTSPSGYAAFGVGDAKGSFSLRNLAAASYLIDPRPPGGWYVKSITIAAPPAARTIDVARDGVSLKSAEQRKGLTVTFSEGAARVEGHVSGTKGQPAPLRVYLAPAEREALDNVLRFYESEVKSDGAFILDNLAPGKYWIVARAPELNPAGEPRLIRQDAQLRASVSKEAELLKQAVILKPCQQLADFETQSPR